MSIAERTGMRHLGDVRQSTINVERKPVEEVKTSVGHNQRINVLTIDSTNIHIANVGKREYIEVGVEPRSDHKTPQTRIDYAGMTRNEVVSKLGERHVRDHIVKVGEKQSNQAKLIQDITQGKTDVGITRGEVPAQSIQEGLMVFSPLYYNARGETIKPKDPITIVARSPRR